MILANLGIWHSTAWRTRQFLVAASSLTILTVSFGVLGSSLVVPTTSTKAAILAMMARRMLVRSGWSSFSLMSSRMHGITSSSASALPSGAAMSMTTPDISRRLAVLASSTSDLSIGKMVLLPNSGPSTAVARADLSAVATCTSASLSSCSVL